MTQQPTTTKRRIRSRRITPSQPPASSYHPVYTFEKCSNPGCHELHMPEATGSTKCPECLENECDIPACLACQMEAEVTA